MTRFRAIVVLALVLSMMWSTRANSVSLAGDEAVTTLRWKSAVIRIAISSSLLRDNPNVKRDSDVTGAIRRSIEVWSRVANVELVQRTSEKQSASPVGPTGDGVNLVTIAPTAENVLLFAKDPENAAATTRVFYNGRGVITEADIVLNPYQQFSTDGTPGTFDLESTLTHEIGHLLGLPHSMVLGSTMHENYGKNGVFGLQNIGQRTLSFDDVAAVRALYGARDDVECCGVIDGQLSPVNRQIRNVQVWIEDATGRVHGSAKVGSDGAFRFSGLLAGRYKVFAQDVGRAKTGIAVQEVAEAAVSPGEVTSIHAKLSAPVARGVDLTHVGLNGQLAEMAPGFSSGRTYILYLGGQQLDSGHVSIGFSTPYITVLPQTTRAHDYGDSISVVSVEIRLAPGLPAGEYTVYVESERGDRRAVVGALAVDNSSIPVSNPQIFQD